MPETLALLDSNILVFAYSDGHAYQPVARSLLKAAATPRSRYRIAEQNLLEWYSVITGVKRLKPLAPAQATKVLNLALASAIQVIRPNRETSHLLKNILTKRREIRGKDIYDRYLAATALSNGVDTILTENVQDFAGIPGLTAINPFE